MTSTADLIVIEGRVLTMDPGRPRAEAVALRDGRVLALGTTSEILALRGPATRVIEAAGGSVLPGINESHIHIFSGANELFRLSLLGIQGQEALAAKVREHAAARPGEALLVANAADYTILGEGRSLDRQVLDAVLPDRPLALVSPDHHTVWANTAALRHAGLLQGRALPPGHEIVMGPDGLATGELRENRAFDDLLALGPTGGRDRLGLSTGGEPEVPPTAAERAQDRAILRRGLAHLARHGITSFQNMDGNLYTLGLLSEIEAEGGLACRGRVPLHYVQGDIALQMDKAARMAREASGEWLTSGTVKVFMDGVLDSHTAVMAEDYEDRPGWRGEPRFDAGTFRRLCLEADRRGLQIAVHSIGDGATARVLDGYAAAREAHGPRDSRHRIEHLELVREEDFARMRDLGVVASMQPPHPPGQCGLPIEPTLSRIGRRNWARAYAWRRIRDLGIPLIFSSDWPVSPVDPWASIHSALTRRPWAADLPDNRQTLGEALWSYTAGAAWAEFAEGWKGRLAPGFAGDLVVLDRDLEAVPAEEIAAAKPVTTVCGGRVTFEAGSAEAGDPA